MILLVLLLAFAMPAFAVDIQYALGTCASSGCFVTGVSDAPIAPAPNYGVVNLPGSTAAQIAWPVPSGCSAGKPEWSRVTDPAAVTAAGAGLAVRPGLLLFSSTSPFLVGCYRVSNLAELDELYRNVIVEKVASFGFVGALNAAAVVVLKRCPGTSGGAGCTTARSNMDTLDNDYPSETATASFTTNLITLRTDKCTFQQAQGWGACSTQ